MQKIKTSRLIASVIVFAVVAAVLLVYTFAGRGNVAFEAEDLTGTKLSQLEDDTASNGSYVQFNKIHSLSDVVVYGAGTSGVAAAVSAARMGSSVVLIEPTDYIGGQLAAGVGTLDDGQLDRQTGFYKEFLDEAKKFYDNRGKSISTCYFNGGSSCVEPDVSRRILESFINRESGITVIKNERAVAVDREGQRVTNVTTDAGKIYRGRIIIDASEAGDLLPLGNIPYRVGNSTSSNVNLDAPIQDITYAATIKQYPGGVPANLRITSKPAGYDQSAPIFRNFIKSNGATTWDWANQPANIRPTLYMAYRGLPDSNGSGPGPRPWNGIGTTKSALNWYNDFPGYKTDDRSTSRTDVLTARYLEDLDHRRSVDCQAKLRTLHLVYFFQVEMGLNWSVSSDENYDTTYNKTKNRCPEFANYRSIEEHMPLQPYIRESRRIIGLDTGKASDLRRFHRPNTSVDVSKRESIALGWYRSDFHNSATQESYFESDLETRAQYLAALAYGRFQVTMDMLIPREIDGFIAAEKNGSWSRTFSSSARLQPITMNVGQAAGIMAAMSVENGIQPRDLNYLEVQSQLLRWGSKVSLSDSKGYSYDGARTNVYEPRSDGFATRGDAANELAAHFNLVQSYPRKTLADVPLAHHSYVAAETLKLKGITTGCGGNNFCPDRVITRAEFATLLARTLNPNVDSQPARGTQKFTDVDPSHWSYKSVQYLFAEGITQGCSATTFCRDDSLRLDHMDIFLDRADPR